MQIKKIPCLILWLSMLMGMFAGCAKDTNTDTTPTATEAPVATPEPTPVPTATPAPTPTDAPAATPKPTPTPAPVLVATAISPDTTFEPENDGWTIPDLRFWSEGKVTADEPDSDRVVWSIDKDDLPMLQDYIDLLINEFGYEIVDSYDAEYGKDRFWSVGLKNTRVETNHKVDVQYLDDVPCDICLWGSDRGNRGQMSFSSDLNYEDTGHRYKGFESRTLYGKSAATELWRNPDGSYTTGDGRLTAQPGQAMVIRDGVPYTAVVRYDGEGNRERLWVENFYRNESLYFIYPDRYLIPGDVWDFYQMMSYKNGKDDNSGENYKKNEPWLSIYHDGEWYYPAAGSDNIFKSFTMRVLYADEGGDAVYYFAFELSSEPREFEMLIVTNGRGSEAAENIVRLTPGQYTKLHIDTGVFSSSYEVYDWTIETASGAAEIESSGGDCTVIALQNGSATVTGTIQFGAQEVDALTGTTQTVPRTKSITWTIIVG